MTTTTIQAPNAVAGVLERAAAHIETVGFCKKYLYSVRQASAGLPLDKCEVDVIGAINVAVHGTPRYVGTSLTVWEAEQAVAASIDAPSVAAWCDYKGNGKAKAIALLRDTAASLREATA